MKYLKLLFLFFLLTFFEVSLFSNLQLDSFSFQNYYPHEVNIKQNDYHSWLKLQSSQSHSYQIPNLVIKQAHDDEDSQIASLITKNTPALAFPNPFRLLDGVEIGFYSSESFDAQLFVYDMLGHLRIKKDILVTNTTYNIIPINITDFQGGAVSAGAYFYVLVRDDEIVRKGKMGVVP